MTKPKDRTKPSEFGENWEVYSDEQPPNDCGDNNRWRLICEASKMCSVVIETDIENGNSIDYLKKRSRFARRCKSVFPEDVVGGTEPQRFRKNVFDKTMLNLTAYFNAIANMAEAERSPLAEKYYQEFKKILK